MRLVDIYWAAGFLDGEGCFSTCGSAARVQATQVSSELLEKLVGLFGGKIYPKKPRGGSQPAFSWVVGGSQAIGLMMMIHKLVSTKRKLEIEKSVRLWFSRGAKSGDRHYNSVATDEEALNIMRRIEAGESMNQLGKELGISHTTMSMWMRGTKRPYLRSLLYGDVLPEILPRNRGAGHRLSSYGDSAVLEVIREIRKGKMTIYRAAKNMGLTFNAVSDWCSGKNRPYLLAQILREEVETPQEEVL